MTSVTKQQFGEFNLHPITDQPIDRVIHISDIHFKSSDESDYILQYDCVLKQLYQHLRELVKKYTCVMVITGDIVHTKTMSPNGTQQVINFFNTLQDILPVFVILGNHDIDNPEDNSVVECIISCAKYTNIHLLNKFAYYHYNNITFGVSNDPGSNNILKIDDDIKYRDVKISLYHGLIKNYEDLKGYDYACLGDLHNYKCLYGEVNNRKKIFNNYIFAGSLIQQNLSKEHVNGMEYGYVVINLEKNTHKFVGISDNYGHIIISADDDTSFPDVIPQYAKIRLDCKNLSFRKITNIKKRIQTKYPNTIISINYLFDEIKDQTFVPSPIFDTKSLYDNISRYLTLVGCGNSILKPYNDDIFSLLKMIVSHVQIENTRLFDTNFEQHIWKIVRITFSNMFSYSGTHVIEFDNNAVITTRQYSSSIFDVITFGLYGKCSRNLEDIVNKNTDEQYFSCNTRILIENKLYDIVHTNFQSKNAKQEKSQYSSLIRIKNKMQIPIYENCGPKQHYKKIKSLLGSYDDFVNMYVMSDRNMTSSTFSFQSLHPNITSKTDNIYYYKLLNKSYLVPLLTAIIDKKKIISEFCEKVSLIANSYSKKNTSYFHGFNILLLFKEFDEMIEPLESSAFEINQRRLYTMLCEFQRSCCSLLRKHIHNTTFFRNSKIVSIIETQYQSVSNTINHKLLLDKLLEKCKLYRTLCDILHKCITSIHTIMFDHLSHIFCKYVNELLTCQSSMHVRFVKSMIISKKKTYESSNYYCDIQMPPTYKLDLEITFNDKYVLSHKSLSTSESNFLHLCIMAICNYMFPAIKSNIFLINNFASDINIGKLCSMLNKYFDKIVIM